jgi:hypothetical protein
MRTTRRAPSSSTADRHRRERAALPVRRHHVRHVQLEQRIPVHDEKRLPAEERLGLLEPAARSENHRLAGIGEPHAEPRAVAQSLLDQMPQVVQVDDDVRDAVPAEQQEIPDN